MEFINGYPEYMRASIEKVARTRQSRVGKSFTAMTLDERKELLSKFHPDYNVKGKRSVEVGTNKGEIIINEVADLLEARPLIAKDSVDLSQIDYDVDVLVIGGGGAGTVAALWANNSGIAIDKILVTTKLRLGDSNSMMAQGGIQAADRPEDSPARHYLDTYGGGHFANKPELVERLVKEAPFIIKWHESRGVLYDRDENGDFLELSGGGTSRNRLHAAKDYTGMEILRCIRDVARNRKIPVLEFTSAVELLTDGERVTGAVLYNMETEQYYVVRAKSVVLATGGFGRLHVQNYPTTNHYGATGDGLVLAYHAGAKLRDMDTAQYHPTGAAFPEQLVGLLITEKVRGLGAQPLNIDGETFVFPLEPRDVEAASFIRECYDRKKGIETPTGMQGIWLDSPLIEIIHGEGAIEKNLGAMHRMFQRFGIDMRKDPVLVFPTLHYQNGGVEIDRDAKTSLEGLFAGGEVEGGVHGKNRLMGNSLLDYNVFGRAAGISAAEYAKKAKKGKLTLHHVAKYNDSLDKAHVEPGLKAPILLPEYRGKEALSRALEIDKVVGE